MLGRPLASVSTRISPIVKESAKPTFAYTASTTDTLDIIVGETYNIAACKFPLIRINRGFYRIRATELEICLVNGKVLARTDAWNNGKFGPFQKLLIHFE